MYEGPEASTTPLTGGAIGQGDGYYGEGAPTFVPEPPLAPCQTNRHIFRCKHEEFCNCGKVQRLGLEVSEGL